MTLEDIIVKPENYDQYNLSTQSVDLGCATVSAWMVNGKELDKCLEAHMSINKFLDENTHWLEGAGVYASWLESMGFDYQSEEGWWSYSAICPETLQCFMKYSEDLEYRAVVDSAIARYSRKPFSHDIKTVEEFVEVFC